jgi:glycosyltransferase involved in cell wall biosynthesis
MSPVPVAFYAPMKSPDHPRPSGDRTMARLLLRALERAGFSPSLASALRTWEPRGDRTRQAELRAESAAEADRLAGLYRALPTEARPRLWFTYHCYYKAPDHLGPDLAGRLGIPYVVAEPSHAPKRAGGAWSGAHAAAESAIRAADALLVLTGQDRRCIEAILRPGQRLVSLPPFTDVAEPYCGRARASGTPRLLTVAMMRPGDKLASYRLLAEALAHLQARPWTLDIVGDGPARPEVEALFAAFAGRVTFHGVQDGPALRALYRVAEFLLWPAVNEAYGMVLLEAQAEGCPVVAGRFGGVRDAMLPGETGLLAAPGDPADLARCAVALLSDPMRRDSMGEAAARFVGTERSVDKAAEILRAALLPALRQRLPA